MLRGIIVGIFLGVSFTQIAYAVSYIDGQSLTGKKICLFEVAVDYDGSRDILVSRYRCDGGDSIVLETKKLENDKILKTEVPRQATLYAKKFLDEGMTAVSCSLTPPQSYRYYARYSCTFARK